MFSSITRVLSSGLRLGSRRTLRTTPAAFSGGYDGWNEDDTKQTTRMAEDTFDKASGELHSVERTLEKYLPEAELQAVKQIMYGLNQGEIVKTLELPQKAQELADAGNFDISISKFNAGADGRDPRIVRFGVTQNAIISPTTDTIQEQ